MSRGLTVGACLAWLMLLAACGGRQSSETPGTQGAGRIEDTRLAMGSSLTLVAWSADEGQVRAAFDAVYAEFDRLDRMLSVWKPDSDVSRLNRAAGAAPVAVSPETIEVLDMARVISEATDGLFDVTFGALTDIWKFDHDLDGEVPTPEAIASRLALVDYRAVRTDPAAGTASLARPGMRVHLGGIGKGFAVDRAVAILRDRGVHDFMVQAGGDLYVSGKKGDVPWRLGIADPRAADGPPFATMELTDSTLSTSGDYERFFLKDGVRYHHILDLRNGQPARGCRSVTLVSARAVMADALAKGVFVLGPEAGMALIERLPDVEGVIVAADNRVLVSSGLQGRLSMAHPPTDAP